MHPILQALLQRCFGLAPGDQEAPDPARLQAGWGAFLVELEALLPAAASGGDSLGRLQQIVAAVKDAALVSRTDARGRIIEVNERFCRLSGFRREDLLGANHHLISSGVHSPAFYAEMWATLRAGRAWHGELCNCARSGAQYWIESTIYPLCDEAGTPVQFIAISHDITARKFLELRLHEQSHISRQILDAVPLPVYIKDEAGTYLGVNRAFTEFFKVRAEDWVGRSVTDLLAPAQAARQSEMDAEVCASGQPRAEETNLQLPGGSSCPVLSYKAPVTRADGVLYGVVGTVTDLSTQRKLELDLFRAREAAEAANQLRRNFLANIDQQVRAPMNGLIGLADLLLDTPVSEQQREFLLAMQHSASSLLEALGDILEVSNAEGSGVGAEIAPFELEQVVAGAVQHSTELAEEKQLRLRVDISSALPEVMIGDAQRLRQVLGHLLDNAVKTTVCGEIGLSVLVERINHGGMDVQFIVYDSAPGVPAQEQLFDDAASAAGPAGQGAGSAAPVLALCSRLVELMGGCIWVDSLPAGGNQIHVALSLGCAAEREEALRQLAGAPRVLLVDGDPERQRALAEWLRGWGAEVQQAASFAEAGQWLGQEKFALVLCENSLPDGEGRYLLQRLREIRAEGAFLILSGRSSDVERLRVQMRGQAGVAFLARPLLPGQLWRALQPVLGRPPASPASEFDYDAFLKRADPEVIAIIGEIFVQCSGQDFASLEQCAARADLEGVRHHAHSLRGAASNFGPSPVVQLCSQLEHAARDGHLAGDVLPALRGELLALRMSLQARIAAAAG